jgi:hypothetical protein
MSFCWRSLPEGYATQCSEESPRCFASRVDDNSSIHAGGLLVTGDTILIGLRHGRSPQPPLTRGAMSDRFSARINRIGMTRAK